MSTMDSGYTATRPHTPAVREERADYSAQPWCPAAGCTYRCTPGTDRCWHHKRTPGVPYDSDPLASTSVPSFMAGHLDPRTTVTTPDHIDYWRDPTTGKPTPEAAAHHAVHTSGGQAHDPGCFVCILWPTAPSDPAIKRHPLALPTDRPTTVDDIMALRQPPKAPSATDPCTATCADEHEGGWTCIHGRSATTAKYAAGQAPQVAQRTVTADDLDLHATHIAAGKPSHAACVVCQETADQSTMTGEAMDDGLPVEAVALEEMAEFRPTPEAQAIAARLRAQQAAGTLPGAPQVVRSVPDEVTMDWKPSVLPGPLPGPVEAQARYEALRAGRPVAAGEPVAATEQGTVNGADIYARWDALLVPEQEPGVLWTGRTPDAGVAHRAHIVDVQAPEMIVDGEEPMVVVHLAMPYESAEMLGLLHEPPPTDGLDAGARAAAVQQALTEAAKQEGELAWQRGSRVRLSTAAPSDGTVGVVVQRQVAVRNVAGVQRQVPVALEVEWGVSDGQPVRTWHEPDELTRLP